MPRGIPNRKPTPPPSPALAGTALASIDVVLEELRTLLEARRTEYLSAADLLGDILASMAPKPRIGRPRKDGHA